MNLQEMVEKLAEEMLHHHDRLSYVVDSLDDEELTQVIAECRRLAQPTETRTFRSAEWGIVADILESEMVMRAHFLRAEAHTAATGELVYCIHCGGSCTQAHIDECKDD